MEKIFIWIKGHIIISILIGAIIIGSITVSPIIISNTQNKTNIELNDNLNFELDSEVYLISLIKKISNGELKTDNKKIDTSTLGEQEISIKYLNEKNQETDYKFTINIVDTTPPTIESEDSISTTIGKEVDLLSKVSTSDNSRGEVNVTIEGDYNLDIPGDYNLKYVATDSSGNKSEKNFVLKVSSATIKTKGYYVYKTKDVWYEMSFTKNNEVSYVPWYCPGYACGGGDDQHGTYSIDGNTLNVHLKYEYSFEGDKTNINKKMEFTIINENQIKYNGKTYKWQKSFEG